MSTGGGNGKSLQYSCCKNPMSNMKRQKIWHQKMSTTPVPRSEGVQYAIGEEQRAITNSSRKNEAAVLMWKWCSAVDVSGGESEYFGHLMQRVDSLEKTLRLKYRRQKEKGAAEDEMVREHHWLNGHESEKALGDRGGQGRLVSPSVAGHGATKSWTQFNQWTTISLS